MYNEKRFSVTQVRFLLNLYRILPIRFSLSTHKINFEHLLIFQVWKRNTEDILLQSRVDWISEAIQRNKAIKEANIESINDYFISKWNSIFLVINKTTDELKSPWHWLETTHLKFFVVDFFSFFLNSKIQPNWFVESSLKA